MLFKKTKLGMFKHYLLVKMLLVVDGYIQLSIMQMVPLRDASLAW